MSNLVGFNDNKVVNLKIIIIEDEEYKYNKLKEVLNRILDNSEIIRAKSRNSALRIIKEYYRRDDYFELIICDNYMPLFDNDNRIIPCAYDIINYIRRTISKEVPICVCSSEKVDLCNYDYYIKYDSSLSLETYENEFKQIFSTINKKKRILLK